MQPTEKLQKVMARAGVASRRACEQLIAAGRVTIDGRVASLADRVAPGNQRVCVDGRELQAPPAFIYLILHKPVGYVTTAHDPQGRPTVLDLLKGVDRRVFPVGRLDLDSEGLVLLTNDGALAQGITHPSFEVPRLYEVTVRGAVGAQTLEHLEDGIELDDGLTAPTQTTLLRRQGNTSVLRIRMHEGRNRQVRRMCQAVGHPVLRLVRVALGPLRLDGLASGACRALTPQEVQRLQSATGLAGHEFTAS